MGSPLDFQSPRAGFARGMRTFAGIVAAVRAECWPIELLLADDSTVAVAKSPSTLTRTADPHAAGYIQRTHATFLFPVDGDFVPTLGAEWAISDSEFKAEIGERWRCFEVHPGAAGVEHRAVCFRLD